MHAASATYAPFPRPWSVARKRLAVIKHRLRMVFARLIEIPTLGAYRHEDGGRAPGWKAPFVLLRRLGPFQFDPPVRSRKSDARQSFSRALVLRGTLSLFCCERWQWTGDTCRIESAAVCPTPFMLFPPSPTHATATPPAKSGLRGPQPALLFRREDFDFHHPVFNRI